MVKCIEEYVQVDDFKMYTKKFKGKKLQPVIIMEAGYGDYSKTWDHIAEELTEYGTVLTYDRAGLGKSRKSSKRRISSEMIKGLRCCLTQLQLKPPYIFVGHSFGGINARLFANFYPEDMLGIVLVDSTPENYKEAFLPIMSTEFQEAYYKQFVYESSYEEFTFSLSEVDRYCKSMNDIPLVVLAAGKKAFYSPDAQMKWLQLQEELLRLSSNNKFVIAERSGHYIQKDEPQYITDAVKWIIG
ncbi:alpha/beta fold hydrolase [Bacillus albus]|uniref:alpha/beta fold hydrolase n=1 Tax=Bacillus cereus group TaxID=86661 RepID=UPI0022E461D5|nr:MULTISPECIES: alpha/beta fold hydrolase [Bacillus cereus group]MDA2026004.1 alpha/beta fold hydrolase [Bacillus cereus group sp. Bcc03]MDA2215781.1 alpha/beta fold hydrolase [Bacillus cereus group sp. Bc228]MDA2225843.1 alpha/beta fold hydrolase [Bacillus cereus group sp. Bc227]MDA2260108.1 alpha/beta fold hydrolase [Bacillus cereus group sp. Bc200]MDA2320178.1 alpha/beta fold hydrolase [Bacillus cereus group sp. Bc177]